MQVEHFEITSDDIGLTAQFALSEAYNAYRHDWHEKYQTAMEIGVALEGYAAMENATTGKLIKLAEIAESAGLKVNEELWELAAWSTFT